MLKLDAHRVRMALRNVLDNAVTHTDVSQGPIEVRAGHSTPESLIAALGEALAKLIFAAEAQARSAGADWSR